MFQQAADVITSGVGKSCVPIAGKEWFLTFPQRLVTVHSGTIIAIQGLRHERRRLPKLMCSIADYIFKYLKIIGRPQHRRVTKIDLALTRCRNFVMMAFDSYATLGQSQRDFGA